MGGVSVAVGRGYFLEPMGTEVTILEMMDSVMRREDGDVVAAFTVIAR